MLREIGWDGMDWIDLAQDRDQWRAPVNTAMNLRVPWNDGKFLSSCKIGGFSGRAQLHEWFRYIKLRSWKNNKIISLLHCILSALTYGNFIHYTKYRSSIVQMTKGHKQASKSTQHATQHTSLFTIIPFTYQSYYEFAYYQQWYGHITRNITRVESWKHAMRACTHACKYRCTRTEHQLLTLPQ
jgi:hypothetical protein